jgi:hypothetical protein
MTTCEQTRKVTYTSPQAAYHTAQILGSTSRLLRGKREKHRARDLLCAFKCPHCKGWHLGHKQREAVA